jgi:Sulfotransferase domain
MRLPDFIIIGAAKSGTTSLFSWLEAQPEFVLPGVKEPGFFAHDERWKRGLGWYANLFAVAPPGLLTGEASTSYTNPMFCRPAADRMSASLPDVRLIYLIRNPIERLRSHYRHQLQRGREMRPFHGALGDPRNPYVPRSLYFSCLEPYIESFPRERICVVRFEDLIDEEAAGWSQVLRYLGVPDRSPPRTAHNVTSQKAQYRRTMLWLYKTGVVRPLIRLPRPVRRMGKRLLTKRNTQYETRLEESRQPVPAAVEERIWRDIDRLERWLGIGALWEQKPSAGLTQPDDAHTKGRQ